jgi:hypothetical protein
LLINSFEFEEARTVTTRSQEFLWRIGHQNLIEISGNKIKYQFGEARGSRTQVGWWRYLNASTAEYFQRDILQCLNPCSCHNHNILDMYKSVVLTLLVAAVFGGLASEFDWRNVGGITGTGNQGLCDSAVAWVAATMYETEYYRQTATLPVTSVQFLLECAPNLTCTAGTSYYTNLESTILHAVEKGLPLESAYPYTAGNLATGKPNPQTVGICSASTTKATKAIKINKGHKVSTGTMKSWIAKNPVGAMLYADSNFNSINNNNVYSCTNNSPSDGQ